MRRAAKATAGLKRQTPAGNPQTHSTVSSFHRQMQTVTLLDFSPHAVWVLLMHRFTPLREIRLATPDLKGYNLYMTLRTSEAIQPSAAVYARSGNRCARFHPVPQLRRFFGI